MKTCECALEIIDISKESHLQNASLDEEDFERVAKVVTELVLNYLFLLQKCGPEWVDDFGAATKLGRTKKQQQQLAKPSQNGGTRLKNWKKRSLSLVGMLMRLNAMKRDHLTVILLRILFNYCTTVCLKKALWQQNYHLRIWKVVGSP